ncbi:hypothetical protein [Streptomyces sp. NBC_01563]|uniref:hypothetical protein n=1 Tax=Streptomyces sp. NBC_01563 TaxID=2975880 RepID=UPI0038708F98
MGRQGWDDREGLREQPRALLVDEAFTKNDDSDGDDELRLDRYELPAGLTGEVTAGLQRLADHLDTAPGLTDYRRRRALTSWTLPHNDWKHLSAGLPAQTSRRFAESTRHNVATALIWMEITQGHHRHAPVMQQAGGAGEEHRLREVRCPGYQGERRCHSAAR